MKGRALVAALYVVLVVAFAAGIWASYRAAFPGKGLYRVSGVFEARWGQTGLLVKHEAVPGLMDEMNVMSLEVESAELIDRARLERGDRVRLTVRQVGDQLVVIEVQKLP